MATYLIKEQNRRLSFELSRAGRVRTALFNTSWIFVAVFLVLSLLLVPDFWRDYSLLGSAYGQFFFNFIFGIAALIALIFGGMRALARQRWTFDTARRTLQYWAKTSFGREVEAEAPLKTIRAIVLRHNHGLLRRTHLGIEFTEAPPSTLASGRLDAKEIEDLYQTLQRTLEPLGVSFSSSISDIQLAE